MRHFHSDDGNQLSPIFILLEQGCSTSGLWANSSPWHLVSWPTGLPMCLKIWQQRGSTTAPIESPRPCTWYKVPDPSIKGLVGVALGPTAQSWWRGLEGGSTRPPGPNPSTLVVRGDSARVLGPNPSMWGSGGGSQVPGPHPAHRQALYHSSGPWGQEADHYCLTAWAWEMDMALKINIFILDAKANIQSGLKKMHHEWKCIFHLQTIKNYLNL